MKKEILLHTDDVSHPLSYTPYQLHGDLIPKVTSNGTYHLQGEDSNNIGVYIYDYGVQTEPASSASSESLLYDTVMKSECEVKYILPQQSGIKFRIFVVPVFLVDETEAKAAAMAAAKEAMRLLYDHLHM